MRTELRKFRKSVRQKVKRDEEERIRKTYREEKGSVDGYDLIVSPGEINIMKKLIFFVGGE